MRFSQHVSIIKLNVLVAMSLLFARGGVCFPAWVVGAFGGGRWGRGGLGAVKWPKLCRNFLDEGRESGQTAAYKAAGYLGDAVAHSVSGHDFAIKNFDAEALC